MPEAFDSGDEGAANTRLQCRMPGIRHDGQPRRRPRRSQLECGARRTDHVVAALHDFGGNVADPMHVAEQALARQEQVVRKIVRLDARKAECRAVLRE